jgi:hypothetical protein
MVLTNEMLLSDNSGEGDIEMAQASKRKNLTAKAVPE